MRIAYWLTAAATLAAPAVARAQVGPLNGTQPNDLAQPLAAAGQCSECHGGIQTPDGHDYMPSDLWPSTVHASAVRDPLFLATLSLAEQDVPGLGTFCLRCHTPAAFTAGHATPGNGSALQQVGGDLDGVHCDTCHRSIDASTRATNPDPMAPYTSNAQLFFDDAPVGQQVTRHGPYTDPFMSNRHLSIGDPFIHDARMCGQCHDLDNPLVHRLTLAGEDTGAPFPLQSTFTEWRQSAFPTVTNGPSTCQDCHMDAITGSLAEARVANAPERTMARQHDFPGGNEWLMGLMAAAYPGDNDDGYATQRERERATLRTAATLEVVDAPRDAIAGSTARITVRVTNNTGHKLPTGYEDARVMWLQIAAGDSVVSGAFVDDALVEDPQLRAYRFQAGHFANGHATAEDHIAVHDVVIEDTRIPPRGMVPDARTMPVGRDYSGGAAGALRNDDVATFDVPIPATTGPLTVTVRLFYQATTKHYVQTVAGDNHSDDRGQRLLAAWQAAGRGAPFEMAAQQVTVDVTGGIDADAGTVDARLDEGGSGGGGSCHCRAGRIGGARGAMAVVLGIAALLARRKRGP